MRLRRLSAKNYRSVRKEDIDFAPLNLFIGANASGKSTILDALRFLYYGLQSRDFRSAVNARGGISNLAWKGEGTDRTELTVAMEDGDHNFEWSLRIIRQGYEFDVEEEVDEVPDGSPRVRLLESSRGAGWWRSGEDGKRVTMMQARTACALATAAADTSFPGRQVAKFIGCWGFFDPNPHLLRLHSSGSDTGRLDPYGRNFGETLLSLQRTSPEALDRIVAATREVLGLPTKVEPRESPIGTYILLEEPGLDLPVHQLGVSSGTLRMLALMTALFGEPETNLVGIEEPENYVHPTALSSFVEHLKDVQKRVQILLTTHSPLLLDYLDDPGAVCVVQRHDSEGTKVLREKDPKAIRRALDASGFGLGELYETKGFGAD